MTTTVSDLGADPTDRRVAHELDRLHRAAKGDWRHFARALPYVVLDRVTGRTLRTAAPRPMPSDAYLSVSRPVGSLLYTLARGIRAERIVEFGTSFGVSAIYLGLAVRDNGGGEVVTAEVVPAKCQDARMSFQRAGLTDTIRVLEGDALHTLASVDGPIDMLFLDGAKHLYGPLLRQMTPKLRDGALVVADDVNLAAAAPYLAEVRENPCFASVTLASHRLECSWYVAPRTGRARSSGE